MTAAHRLLVEACAFRPLRTLEDLEAHRAWAAYLLTLGHRPEWLQTTIAAASAAMEGA